MKYIAAAAPSALMALLFRRCALFLLLAVVGGSLSSVTAAQPRTDTLAPADRQARAAFVQGLTASALGNYSTAVDRFQSALDRAPGTPGILSALADAQAARGDTTAALYYARQARDRAPDRRYYHRRLGTLQRDAGELRAATATYRRVLARFPGATEVRLALARLLTDRDQPRAALRAYETAVDSSTRPLPAAYEAMVPLYRQTQDMAGLEAALLRLVELRPAPSRPRQLLAQLYADQGRVTEAIQQLEALRRVRPGDPEVLGRLQRLYRKAGRPDTAATRAAAPDSATTPRMLVAQARSRLQAASPPPDSVRRAQARRLLRRALRQDSADVDALDLLARLQRRSGAPTEALATYRRALDADPRAPERWRQAAAAALAADRPATAAQLAREGLLLFPGRFALRRLLAQARARQGRLAAARRHYRAATEQMSASASSAEQAALYAGLGRVESRLGHYAAADTAYQQALDIRPKFSAALNGYARSLARRDAHLNRALTMAQQATAQDSANPSYLDTLGWIYLRRDAPREAASVLQKALDLGVPSAALLEHYGDAQAALGNDATARTYWEKALERAPNRASVQKKLGTSP